MFHLCTCRVQPCNSIYCTMNDLCKEIQYVYILLNKALQVVSVLCINVEFYFTNVTLLKIITF